MAAGVPRRAALRGAAPRRAQSAQRVLCLGIMKVPLNKAQRYFAKVAVRAVYRSNMPAAFFLLCALFPPERAGFSLYARQYAANAALKQTSIKD